MLRADGAFESYHGGLRARDPDGETIFDRVDCRDYEQVLREEVKPWSYMKFPFIASLGPELGWYRVGPLARVNNCDRFDTPLAEQERHDFMAAGEGRPLQAALATHWARLIELLHCAEAIKEVLHDPDLLGRELRLRGEMRSKGIGVLEAPRGTLFHHYEIDGDGLVRKANLIVSTTNNNQVMNESIRQVASHYLDGKELTEPLLNQIEVAIRAFDPCLSCATHAVGKMPLEIELVNAAGRVVDRIHKRATGPIEHEPCA
jgi:NAD-reducing hydrogenase large subunit